MIVLANETFLNSLLKPGNLGEMYKRRKPLKIVERGSISSRLLGQDFLHQGEATTVGFLPPGGTRRGRISAPSPLFCPSNNYGPKLYLD